MNKILYCKVKGSKKKISLPFAFKTTSKIKDTFHDDSPLVVLDQSAIKKLNSSNLPCLKDKICFVFFSKPDRNNLKIVKKFGFFDYFTAEDSKEDIAFKFKRTSGLLKIKKQIKSLEGCISLQNEKIEKILLVDPVTSCYNWRYFLNRAHQELSSSLRHLHDISFMAIDVDNFRQVNEIYGVEVADKVVKKIAEILKDNLRREDILTRWRGDEFFIMIPYSVRKNAQKLAERIKNKISGYKFKYRNLVLRIKVSIGIVSSHEDNIFNTRDAIAALYKCITFGKRKGGNIIVLYSQIHSKQVLEEKDKLNIDELRGKIKKLESLLTRDLLEMIYGFARAIEAKDSYTGEHVEYTSTLAEKVANSLHLPPVEVENIRHAAVLHDLGKVGISERILSKNGPLTRKEREVIKTHPSIATEILREIRALRGAVPGVLYHHERFDGNGYPLGLKGDEIPLAARIVAVSDVYQALTSDRPYRKAFSKVKAVKIIREEAGKQFDPKIVEIFLSVLAEINE